MQDPKARMSDAGIRQMHEGDLQIMEPTLDTVKAATASPNPLDHEFADFLASSLCSFLVRCRPVAEANAAWLMKHGEQSSRSPASTVSSCCWETSIKTSLWCQACINV